MYGFSLKKFFRVPDQEFVYKKDDITIAILYALSAFPSGKIDMGVDVILTVAEDRRNLLKCNNIFDSNLLEALETKVKAVTALE